MTRYPESVMEILRQRRGLDEEDTSQDERIEQMRPRQVVDELCAWELGDSGWADWFISRIEQVGGKVEFNQ